MAEEKNGKIFGNEISKKTRKKAVKSREKYVKKFGDDSEVKYEAVIEENPHIGEILGVKNIVVKPEEEDGIPFDTEKGLIVGNIRMGFGHYRISMAIASAAHSMGYTPYWMDLNSYPETTCTKVISSQNDLYSLGSRISQKSRLFGAGFPWYPEGASAGCDSCVAGSGSSARGNEECGERDSGQLAHGSASGGRKYPYGADTLRLSGLPDPERYAEEGSTLTNAGGYTDLYGPLCGP